MSNIYQPTTTDETSSTAGGVTEEAKTQGAHLAQGAVDATADVAGTAKGEASKVASEAKAQAKDLLKQTSAELKEQAGAQQQRVAAGLHSVKEELDSMASSSENGGVATELVQQVSSRAGALASYLEDRDPGTLLDDVRDFARRRPGTFIGIAAVAGVLAGRLTRSLASGNDSGSAASTDARAAAPETPVAPVSPVYPATAPSDRDSLATDPLTAAPGSYVAGTSGSYDDSATIEEPTNDDTFVAPFETTSPAEAGEYPSEFNGNGELRP